MEPLEVEEVQINVEADERVEQADLWRGSSIHSLEEVKKKTSTVASWVKNQVGDWMASALVGFLVVSYWRGTWTLLDIWFCGQPDDASLASGTTFCFIVDAAVDPELFSTRRQSAVWSYIMGLIALAVGVLAMWLGLWRPVNHRDKVRRYLTKCCRSQQNKQEYDLKEMQDQVTVLRGVIRFVIVYILGLAAVGTWRGVWYLQDAYLLPNQLTDGESTWGLPIPLTSYWVSCLVGAGVCYLLCSGASLLAPPSIFLLDGPGRNPPPLTVTIVSSYYALTYPAYRDPPKLSPAIYALDSLLSFIIVPIFVVFYWRGTWMLLDTYLWGFAPEPRAVNVSIGYGVILAAICLGAPCELIMKKINIRSMVGLEIVNRIRTFILALGTCSFWRVVWYIWDQFLPGPTYASSWISHVVGLAGLTLLGCVSCICAPPSTMGVDCVPNPMAPEDPLFDMIPLNWDILYLGGIGRKVEFNLFQDEMENVNNQDESSRQPGSAGDVTNEEAQFQSAKEAHAQGRTSSGKLASSSLRSTGLRASEIRSYYEIQRGDQMSRRNRQDFFDSIRSGSMSSLIAYGRKMNSQSSLHRNR